jgi:tetratricopeptide (TPR) repeat protein
VPQFIETDFFLARVEVVTAIALSGSTLTVDVGAGSAKAQTLLASALTRFPDSVSVNYLSGTYSQLAGDCRAAIDRYDKTLAFKSLHEDALLGRTACLSFLKCPDEAIAAATRMIDLHTDNWGDAYYWRAWNLHGRQQLDAARADIDRAKSLAPSAQTLTLAGIIEHDQDALAIAETDLNRAKTLTPRNRNCTAMWYLALVKLKQDLWLDSARNFEDAMGCYEANVKDDERRLQDVRARPDLEPDFKARQIAGFEKALKDDRGQQYAAAFNAANQSARGGNMERARMLIDIAADDPGLADKVAQLREAIK